MLYEIPFDGLRAYATLVGITLLAAAAPLVLIRTKGLSAALKTSAIAAALVLPFTLGIAYTISDNQLRIDDKNLTVRAAYFYGYSRPINDFDLDRAQIGAHASMADAQLKWRRNGASLPGVSAGSFSTTRNKLIFAILTDRSNVLYLPATTGPSLVVSLHDPASALATLRSRQR